MNHQPTPANQPTVDTRRCPCGAEFVPTVGQIRWHRWRCQKCIAAANRKYRPKGYKYKPTNAEWQREYQRRPEVLARRNELLLQYRKDPNRAAKMRARTLLKSAVRWGHITRKPCEVCGDPKTHGHHNDYSKPYDVRWLCHKHHNEVHHPKSQ